MAGRRLRTYVHGVDKDGAAFVVGPDDTVTDAQAVAITNEDVWATDEDEAAPGPNQDSFVMTEGVVTPERPAPEPAPAPRDVGEESAGAGVGDAATANQDSNVDAADAPSAVVPEPPRNGPGATKAAWAEYAEARGVAIDRDSMNRDDIIDAVDASGGKRDPEPF